MTELFGPAQVHDRAGSGSSNEGVIPRYALLSFQRPCRQKRRVSPPRHLRLEHEKSPSPEGPVYGSGRVPAVLGSSYEAALFVIRSKSDPEV